MDTRVKSREKLHNTEDKKIKKKVVKKKKKKPVKKDTTKKQDIKDTKVVTKKVIKKKKKVKFKFKNIFIILILLIVLYFGINSLLNYKIQNIIIYNDGVLKDNIIIDQAGISDYPSFFKTFNGNIEKNIEKNPLVEKATVKKEFLGIVKIYVDEYDLLFYKKSNNKAVLSNSAELVVDNDIILPTLINYVPDEQYELLIKRLSKVDKEILNSISEIQYDPNDVDDERFLLSMSDGNYVYTNLSKMTILNNYKKIYKETGNVNGTLYLDSVNSAEENTYVFIPF